jgi:hypothetical protein
MNAACAQTSGIADPVGRPGSSLRLGIGSASQTCSGNMPPGLAIAVIASRNRQGIAPGSERFEFVNVWRPIRGPLRDAPLAVCHATTVAFTDFVPSDLVYRDRTGEIYRVRYNPAHRWFYVPEMHVDEVLLIRHGSPPIRPLKTRRQF